MRIGVPSGDVDTHWCGRARCRCMARGLGCHWIVASSTRVCVLAEVPPDRCRQAMVASRRNGGDAMEVMFEPVAALDVGKETVTVCLRTPGPKGRHAETRTFKTTTGSLHMMRDWLVEA